MEQGASRQREHVEALGQDVLAQVTLGELVAVVTGVVEELGVNQVHLAQVGLRRVHGHPRTVLHRHPGVGVTFDPVALDQGDALARVLAEPMLAVLADPSNERFCVARHDSDSSLIARI